MTVISTLILDGYRQDNVIDITATEPTAAETVEGLRVYNAIKDMLFGDDLGENLREWNITDPQRTASVAARWPQAPLANDKPSGVYLLPPANARIMCNIAVATTIYFPEAPSDGALMGFVDVGMTATATLNGNGRLIDDGTTVATTLTIASSDDEPMLWMYDSSNGTWVRVDEDFEEDDESFLPKKFDYFLACFMSVRLCPRHGKTASLETVDGYKRGLSKLQARYRQEVTWVGGGADLQPSAQSAGFNPFATG